MNATTTPVLCTFTPFTPIRVLILFQKELEKELIKSHRKKTNGIRNKLYFCGISTIPHYLPKDCAGRASINPKLYWPRERKKGSELVSPGPKGRIRRSPGWKLPVFGGWSPGVECKNMKEPRRGDSEVLHGSCYPPELFPESPLRDSGSCVYRFSRSSLRSLRATSNTALRAFLRWCITRIFHAFPAVQLRERQAPLYSYTRSAA